MILNRKKMKKIPGQSWIHIDKEVHKFFAGDYSHPDILDINNFGKEVLKALKLNENYVPDISLVSHNLSNEDKKKNLCGHSEKTATYYGLLKTPEKTPLVIFQNMRVCSDCHEHTSLISKIYNREIRLRDASCWHIFVDGKCNCNGKW